MQETEQHQTMENTHEAPPDANTVETVTAPTEADGGIVPPPATPEALTQD